VTTLGQVDAATVAPFRIQMSLTTYSLIQGWAADPSTLPGLVLYPTAGNDDLVSLLAGAARLRIGYSHIVSGATVVDTVNTAIPLDFYMRSPPLSPPTGSEPALVLGGQFDAAVPLHFPATAVPEGSTVNEASLRLRVDPSSPLSSRPEGVKILVRRLRSPWAESVTERASLDPDSLSFASRSAVVLSGPADSVITITLPQEIIREWTRAGGVNEGLMLTVERANRAPEIILRARESGVPIELRVSTTTPPPGRF
jgi:hypothetical protein